MANKASPNVGSAVRRSQSRPDLESRSYVTPDTPSREDWINRPTFGAEFECLIALKSEVDPSTGVEVYSLVSDPSIRNEEPYRVISTLLRKFLASQDDVPAEFSKVEDEGDLVRRFEFSAWYVYRDGTINADEDDFVDGVFKPKNGAISEFFGESTVGLVEREGVEFHGIEMCTPILPATEEGFAVVRAFCRFLNAHSFATNETASMHVHVANQKFANGPGLQLTYEALLKLVRFWMCAEFQMCQLQPFHRVLGKEVYNPPLTRIAPLKLFQRELYEYVARKRSFVELVDRYGIKQCGLNIMRLNCKMDDNVASTIEFRTGEATLSADRAVDWIKFITSLLRKVQEDPCDPREFIQFHTKDTPITKVLTDIGLPEFIGKLPVFSHEWEDYLKAKAYVEFHENGAREL